MYYSFFGEAERTALAFGGVGVLNIGSVKISSYSLQVSMDASSATRWDVLRHAFLGSMGIRAYRTGWFGVSAALSHMTEFKALEALGQGFLVFCGP